jgi:CO/xanthine dehydrogenase Mo-binding subunit
MNLIVNGTEHAIASEPLRPLLYVLREELDVTGPKAGCQQGGCGACTVLVDGEPRRACLVPSGAVDGAAITTVEGLGSLDCLSEIQKAFYERYAAQCGFCTSGMMLASKALIERKGGEVGREDVIEYEEREPFLDVRKAWDPDQPQVTPDGNVRYYYPDQAQQQVRKGNVEKAFDDADFIVEGVYRPAAIEQAPTETQVALSVPEPSGRLVVYSTTQAMYLSMDVVARHLELPLNRLRFVGGTLGGAFGGKVDTVAEAISAVLAVKAQRPVKWRWTREEEMLASSTRAPYHVEVADAVTKDGWILGRRTLTLHDAGAYTRFSSYGATKHTFHLAGAYTVPSVAFNTFVVWTNRVPTSAMRGFGVTSVSFAIETHMSRVAEVIGMDPWELRLKNANRVGDTSPTRVVYDDPSTVSTLLAAADAAGVELGAEYEAMTGEKREGDLLPEHLMEQQKEPEPHPLAWEGSKPGGMNGGNS